MASKSSLLFAVGSTISQWKWRWFQCGRNRRMMDMQLFDDASRGPWGSFVLLATPRSWSVVSLGALVSILALVFDPFAQQLLIYPVRAVTIENSTGQASDLPRATNFVPGPGINDFNETEIQKLIAIWDLTEESKNFAQSQCSTGNCIWDGFESLSFCTKCDKGTTGIKLTDTSFFWNATPYLSSSERYYNLNKSFNINLPSGFQCHFPPLSVTAEITMYDTRDGGYFAPSNLFYPGHIFGYSSPASNIFYYYSADSDEMILTEPCESGVLGHHSSNPTYDWQIHPLPLLNMCHIQLQRGTGNGHDELFVKEATICQMTPCVKKHSYSIVDGVLDLKTTDSRWGSWYFDATGFEVVDGKFTSLGNENSSFALTWGDKAGKNGRVLDLANMSRSLTTYSMNDTSYLLFNDTDMLYGEIPISIIYNEDPLLSNSNVTGIGFRTKNFSADVLVNTYPDAVSVTLQYVLEHGGLSSAVPRLAAHLSRYFREKGNIPVKGKAMASVTLTEIRWRWIILPIVTWALGAGFVLISIWVCRGDQPLWKNSSLPLIYHGFETDVTEDINAGFDHLELATSMQKSARTIYAQFQRSSVDGQLRLTRTFDENDESR
ncbi:hypothetical protein GGR57DRAFT_167517 [Xylariaceae sp. FL1272]|nr:hypothetical protein GGR57DRAFT_167517 [Xylariaceae sp. FL1272]